MRINGKQHNIDYTLRAFRPAPLRDDGIMAIHTGLSVTVAGHLVRLERDERRKVAHIMVEVINGHTVSGLETEAIKAAAELLRQRATRFLGDWRVIGLPDSFSIIARAG